jgi:trigger factor
MSSESQVADSVEESADELIGGTKLALDVSIQSTGPCKRHVRVRIPAADIEKFRESSLKEFAVGAVVPGFRAGKVPSALVQRRYKTELADQVRQKLLMTSLEQIAEDNKLDPINEPDFDFESLVVPDNGDFEYEFDVEVRPEFDLPTYAGLKIKRPIKAVGEEDIDNYLLRFQSQFASGTTVDGPVEAGMQVIAEVDFVRNGELLRHLHHQPLELKAITRFPDAELVGLDKLLLGAKAGDELKTTVSISSEAEFVEMRGETVDVVIKVEEVQVRSNPELNNEFAEKVGFESIEDLRDEVRSMLDRQVVFQQRQETRKQVLLQITASATWDLPESMVSRQVENALRREILEMRQAGFTSEEVRARENEIRQRSITTTRQALKEHFVLDKIATLENIEVTPIDIEAEIQSMALQSGETPRRLRARLTKTGMLDNLEAQIRERKAVDHILKYAEFEDIASPPVPTVDVQSIPIAICGNAALTSDVDEHDDSDEETSN